jgi:hypothetical protein
MLTLLGFLEQEAASRASAAHLNMLCFGGRVFKGGILEPCPESMTAITMAQSATRRYEHEHRRHLKLVDAMLQHYQ